MKKLLLLGLLALALCSCGRKTIIGVSFPEAPIEIATNSDFGMQLINMYNIIRTPDGTYRMYFIANPADELRLLRILNVPARGIGPGSVEKCAEIARREGKTFYEILQTADQYPELQRSSSPS